MKVCLIPQPLNLWLCPLRNLKKCLLCKGGWVCLHQSLLYLHHRCQQLRDRKGNCNKQWEKWGRARRLRRIGMGRRGSLLSLSLVRTRRKRGWGGRRARRGRRGRERRGRKGGCWRRRSWGFLRSWKMLKRNLLCWRNWRNKNKRMMMNDSRIDYIYFLTSFISFSIFKDFFVANNILQKKIIQIFIIFFLIKCFQFDNLNTNQIHLACLAPSIILTQISWMSSPWTDEKLPLISLMKEPLTAVN